MPRKRKAWKTGAGFLCAGLFYGLILIPLGFRIPCLFYRATGLRCPGCGVTVTNVARYCPECGARLPKGAARREAAV